MIARFIRNYRSPVYRGPASDWIPTRKGLPGVGDDHLFLTKSGKIFYGFRVTDREFDSDTGQTYTVDQITHWRSITLPEGN